MWVDLKIKPHKAPFQYRARCLEECWELAIGPPNDFSARWLQMNTFGDNVYSCVGKS